MRGNAIDTIAFDMGKVNCSCGIYMPDTDFLNEQIRLWASLKIRFMGIFHTHCTQWSGLSAADKEYIAQIITSVPACALPLYFPIIYPNLSIDSFVVKQKSKDIIILRDGIKIK